MFLGKVDRYILRAPLPYFLLSLSLLTLILLIQQATRFAEILSSSQFAYDVTARLVLLIIPGILVFTIPMAALVGVSVGYSRLLNDSELTAMSGGGVSLWRSLRPALLLGLSLTSFSLSVGFLLVPLAASELRRVSGEIALRKLSSPVEPRSFFTGFPGRVVYVRDGNEERGTWGRIFIHWRDEKQALRLITARAGRINYSGNEEELFLQDAVVTSIGEGNTQISEKASEFRLKDERLREYKSAFLEKLRSGEKSNDELSLSELVEKASAAENPAQRREAHISLHRRLALCVSPLVLCFAGALSVVKMRRGGKINGLLVSLCLMLFYYLCFLLGEQSARAEILSPALGLWLAPLIFTLSGCLLFRLRVSLGGRWKSVRTETAARSSKAVRKRGRDGLAPVLGLFDRYVLKSLLGIFVTSAFVLLSIFLIFTVFELLRFITANQISAGVVLRYLILLVPYASLNVIPVCTLISVLICFTLMIRRSEGAIWLTTGLSAYRIILPAAFFSLAVGGGLWLMQETILPEANKLQNNLRAYIRSGEASLRDRRGEKWFGSPAENRIYSFREGGEGQRERLENLSVYEFDADGVHLKRVAVGALASVEGNQLRLFEARVYDFAEGHPGAKVLPELALNGEIKGLLNSEGEPADELSTNELSETLRVLKSEDARTSAFSVALESRRLTPLTPTVLALVAAPFAFLFTRQKILAGISYSVLLSLLFLAATKGFQSLGSNGLLPPVVAAWASPSLFSALGVYLLAKVRT
jgi:LPS export ABC transporter permease LptF/LPS export ABC transporter permease LptG